MTAATSVWKVTSARPLVRPSVAVNAAKGQRNERTMARQFTLAVYRALNCLGSSGWRVT